LAIGVGKFFFRFNAAILAFYSDGAVRCTDSPLLAIAWNSLRCQMVRFSVFIAPYRFTWLS
jgi:hypothetical protein